MPAMTVLDEYAVARLTAQHAEILRSLAQIAPCCESAALTEAVVGYLRALPEPQQTAALAALTEKVGAETPAGTLSALPEGVQLALARRLASANGYILVPAHTPNDPYCRMAHTSMARPTP